MGMAGYYVREGEDTDLFVINLAGGGACTDEAKCSARNLTRKGSSAFDLDSKRGTGLIDTSCDVNPGFCEATHVHVLYCTSDTHRGIREPSDDLTWYSDYYFDGHSNFKAIVEILKQEKGLNNNADTKVLLTGISAGGTGALYNVDTLQEMIPKATVKTAPIAGWFNPGALPDDLPSIFPPSDYTNFKNGEHGNELYDLVQEGEGQEDVWEMRDTLPADCLADYVDDTDDKSWACYSIHIAYPYIKAPIFAISSQYDSYHIYTGGGAPKNINDPEEEIIFNKYVDMYGKATRLSFQQLLDGDTKTTKEHPDGIFAPSCKLHGTPNDITITDDKKWIEIVSDWFFQTGDLEGYYQQIEECSTDQAGLVLPCNANGEECSFEFEDQDPLVEICRQKVEDAGCLETKNKKKCMKCAKQNIEEITSGECSPKNEKQAKKLVEEICSLVLDDPEVPDADDPEAKFVRKKNKKGKKKKSTCGKLLKFKDKNIKKYCRDETYGKQGAAVVCPITCNGYN